MYVWPERSSEALASPRPITGPQKIETGAEPLSTHDRWEPEKVCSALLQPLFIVLSNTAGPCLFESVATSHFASVRCNRNSRPVCHLSQPAGPVRRTSWPASCGRPVAPPECARVSARAIASSQGSPQSPDAKQRHERRILAASLHALVGRHRHPSSGSGAYSNPSRRQSGGW